jgi:hypothetical protein
LKVHAVALTACELLVAFLQACVFAVLTCIYLNDAIHPGHGAFSWIRLPRNTSAVSTWASAPSSATISPRRRAQSVRCAGQFGNLIFGFAVTEAGGIFSLLIALLLLFAL